MTGETTGAEGLKACPFCGSAHVMAGSKGISCWGCGVIVTGKSRTFDRPIWNSRPTPSPREQALEEALRAEEQKRRRCEAALRVARGYVLGRIPVAKAFNNPMAERDLATIDAALGLTPEQSHG